MAKAIQIDFPVRDHEAELQQRLAAAPTEHAAAILDFLELLDVLHKRNVLSTIRGVVGAGDDLVGHISKAAAQPESIRAMRNMLTAFKIMGSIDPEVFEAVSKSIPAQFKDHNLRRDTPRPSIWKIIRTFWSPPVQRLLFAWGLMLAGIGHYMNKETPSTADEA